MPKTVSSETVYRGRVFEIHKDEIVDGDNNYEREVITHNGSAVILPLFDDGTVALVRQYRHPAGKDLLELPAGALEKDEDPETGSHRELEEEIGVVADKLELLAEFYVSPGFLSEKMFLYLATGLTETQQNLDEDEFVEIVRLPLAEAARRARENELEDAKTIIGLIFAEAHIAKQKTAS
jgi:ADP-ribose pyrophosphatase